MAKEVERELPKVLTHDFVICDNTVNRYKWRLLVAGIDLEGFLKNPVCCVQHKTYEAPVGKWVKLWIDGEQLKGTLEFDRNDPEAVKLYWKYIDGYMNAVSLHVIPIEESEDPKLLLPGQRYNTITKSEMLEISLVTIPGQKNAVKLSTPEGIEYKLNLVTNNQNPAKMDDKTTELQEELKQQKQLNAKNLVQMHKYRGVVADGEVEHLEKLAFTDSETVAKMLEARPAPAPEKEEKPDGNLPPATAEGKELAGQMQNFTQGLGNQQKPTDERAGWKYLDFYKKDPDALEAMRKSEPEKYKKLEADFYAESQKLGIETTEQE